jgi:hypothetical protein
MPCTHAHSAHPVTHLSTEHAFANLKYLSTWLSTGLEVAPMLEFNIIYITHTLRNSLIVLMLYKNPADYAYLVSDY